MAANLNPLERLSFYFQSYRDGSPTEKIHAQTAALSCFNELEPFERCWIAASYSKNGLPPALNREIERTILVVSDHFGASSAFIETQNSKWLRGGHLVYSAVTKSPLGKLTCEYVSFGFVSPSKVLEERLVKRMHLTLKKEYKHPPAIFGLQGPSYGAEKIFYTIHSESLVTNTIFPQKLEWVEQLFDALIFLQLDGVAYTQITPQNIFFRDGKVFFGDFKNVVQIPQTTEHFTDEELLKDCDLSIQLIGSILLPPFVDTAEAEAIQEQFASIKKAKKSLVKTLRQYAFFNDIKKLQVSLFGIFILSFLSGLDPDFFITRHINGRMSFDWEKIQKSKLSAELLEVLKQMVCSNPRDRIDLALAKSLFMQAKSH